MEEGQFLFTVARMATAKNRNGHGHVVGTGRLADMSSQALSSLRRYFQTDNGIMNCLLF